MLTLLMLGSAALGVGSLIQGLLRNRNNSLIVGGISILLIVMYGAMNPDGLKESPVIPFIAVALSVTGVLLSIRAQSDKVGK